MCVRVAGTSIPPVSEGRLLLRLNPGQSGKGSCRLLPSALRPPGPPSFLSPLLSPGPALWLLGCSAGPSLCPKPHPTRPCRVAAAGASCPGGSSRGRGQPSPRWGDGPGWERRRCQGSAEWAGQTDGSVARGQQKAACPGPHSRGWMLCSSVTGQPVTADPRPRRDLRVLCCPSPSHRPGGLNSRPALAQAGSLRSACRPANSFQGREGASFPSFPPAPGLAGHLRVPASLHLHTPGRRPMGATAPPCRFS